MHVSWVLHLRHQDVEKQIKERMASTSVDVSDGGAEATSARSAAARRLCAHAHATVEGVAPTQVGARSTRQNDLFSRAVSTSQHQIYRHRAIRVARYLLRATSCSAFAIILAYSPPFMLSHMGASLQTKISKALLPMISASLESVPTRYPAHVIGDVRYLESAERRLSEGVRVDRARSVVASNRSAMDAFELDGIGAKLAFARQALSKAEARRDEAQNEVKDLRQQAADRASGIFVKLLNTLNQPLLACVAGLAGAWGVLGPPTFTTAFHSLAGSLVGGIFAGGSVCFFYADEGDAVVDGMFAIVAGNGCTIGWLLWVIFFLLGTVRWAKSFDCALYACVDEVHMIDNRVIMGAPLLSTGVGTIAERCSAQEKTASLLRV